MKFRNYIWDFDGTLFDTYEFLTKSMQLALRENGIEPDYEHLKNLIHLSVSDVISYYSMQYDVNREKISESYKKFSHKFDFNLIKPFDNISKILKFISDNDGQNFVYTHRGTSIDVMLDFYDLKKYFVEIVDSTYNFPRKPEPDGANYLIEKYDLKKDETIFIGDRELDILCGKNASLKTCLFNKEKITSECDYFIDNFGNFDKMFLLENENNNDSFYAFS